MVVETTNGAATLAAKSDVELSKTDAQAVEGEVGGAEEGGLDAHKKKDKKELPAFFPSHGLTTAGARMRPQAAAAAAVVAGFREGTSLRLGMGVFRTLAPSELGSCLI